MRSRIINEVLDKKVVAIVRGVYTENCVRPAQALPLPRLLLRILTGIPSLKALIGSTGPPSPPALGGNLPQIYLAACKAAKAKGITISCDLNYCNKLWSREEVESLAGGNASGRVQR